MQAAISLPEISNQWADDGVELHRVEWSPLQSVEWS
jgi:hypothetical protein